MLIILSAACAPRVRGTEAGDAISQAAHDPVPAVGEADRLSEDDLSIEMTVPNTPVMAPLYACVKVRAITRDVKLLRFDRLAHYGAFQNRVIDSEGNEVGGGPPQLDPRRRVEPEHVFVLRRGEAVEESAYLWRELPRPGQYRVKIWYSPLWKLGPTVVRELQVIATEPEVR